MKRIKEVIVKIPFNHHEDGVIVILRRYGEHERIVKDGDRVATILGVLSNGTWASRISTTDNWIDAAWHRCRVQSITYRPMELSERGYREVLRYTYEWIHSNVDGWMEGMPRADYFWHLLGAIVAAPGDVWTRELHKERFLAEREENWGGSGVWKHFFRNKG